MWRILLEATFSARTPSPIQIRDDDPLAVFTGKMTVSSPTQYDASAGITLPARFSLKNLFSSVVIVLFDNIGITITGGTPPGVYFVYDKSNNIFRLYDFADNAEIATTTHNVVLSDSGFIAYGNVY